MSNEPATRETWLAERTKYIGGSDIGCILGLTAKYKTPYQLWQEKTGKVVSSIDNANTRRGIILEPAIARYFREETGIQVTLNDQVAPAHFLHPVHSFMSVTPDGIINKDQGNYEAKSTAMQIDPENLPLTWFCQTIWGAGILRDRNIITGDENYIAWIERSLNFGTKHVSFDPSFFQYLISMAGEFWTKYVQTDTPPPPINVEDTLRIFPRHMAGKTIEAGPELIAEIDNLRLNSIMFKEVKDKKEEIEGRLKMIIRDAEAVLIDGEPAITWKAAKDGDTFDTERFTSEYPELAAKFTVIKPGARRFLLKK